MRGLVSVPRRSSPPTVPFACFAYLAVKKSALVKACRICARKKRRDIATKHDKTRHFLTSIGHRPQIRVHLCPSVVIFFHGFMDDKFVLISAIRVRALESVVLAVFRRQVLGPQILGSALNVGVLRALAVQFDHSQSQRMKKGKEKVKKR